MKQQGFIAIVFILGCATGGVAAQLVVPPARASAPGPRLEYYCTDASAAEVLKHLGTKAGPDGWELAALVASKTQGTEYGQQVERYTYCLKRPGG